jgi:hypothetical protein
MKIAIKQKFTERHTAFALKRMGIVSSLQKARAFTASGRQVPDSERMPGWGNFPPQGVEQTS